MWWWKGNKVVFPLLVSAECSKAQVALLNVFSKTWKSSAQLWLKFPTTIKINGLLCLNLIVQKQYITMSSTSETSWYRIGNMIIICHIISKNDFQVFFIFILRAKSKWKEYRDKTNSWVNSAVDWPFKRLLPFLCLSHFHEYTVNKTPSASSFISHTCLLRLPFNIVVLSLGLFIHTIGLIVQAKKAASALARNDTQ